MKHAIPEALWLMGLCSQHGIGVDADLDKAWERFRRAAVAECPNARCELALLDAKDQREKSLELLKQAVDQGHAEAAFRLAEILSEGRAIDVLSFVPMGDPIAAAAIVWTGTDGQKTTFWAGAKEALAIVLWRVRRNPSDDILGTLAEKNARLEVITKSPALAIFVLGFESSGVPPINLFLDCPVGELLNLLPEDRDHLAEFGRMADDLTSLPTTLRDMLLLTEQEYFLNGGSDYTFEAMRRALAQLWCDPWKACRQKSMEYLEKAHKLGHTGVLPERENPSLILRGTSTWAIAKEAGAQIRQRPY